MNPTNTSKMPSAARGVSFYIALLLALLTCPCHLPILLVLLSGTAAGAFLAHNTGLAALLLIPVFLLSLIAALYLAGRNSEARPD